MHLLPNNHLRGRDAASAPELIKAYLKRVAYRWRGLERPCARVSPSHVRKRALRELPHSSLCPRSSHLR